MAANVRLARSWRQAAGQWGPDSEWLKHRRRASLAACRARRYLDFMTAPTLTRTTRTFPDRAEGLGHFFARAGEAPRLVAYDDEVGCPLETALGAVEWTNAVGILAETDLIQAARLGAESAAAMVERRREGHRVFVYLGPRMDAPPVDPYEGSLLYDEPGVRAYEFVQRAHALAHFLRATQGVGAMLAVLSRRAPELRHIKRWLRALFEDASDKRPSQLLTAWFATSGAGFLFLPRTPVDPYVYEEVAA